MNARIRLLGLIAVLLLPWVGSRGEDSSYPGDGVSEPATPLLSNNSLEDREERVEYATHIESARQALELGRTEEARSALASTDAELRGWEYDYLLTQSMKSGQEGDTVDLTFDGGESFVESLAFTPDGNRLVIGSSSNVVAVWDVTEDDFTSLEGHTAASGSVAVSRDGTMFATGGWDGKVFLWDAATGDKLLEYRGHNLPNTPPGDHETTIIRSVCFSPDGAQIVSVAFGNNPFVRHLNCEVHLWSTETGETLTVLDGPHTAGRQDFIVCATFSPNGELVATGGYDAKLKLWDVRTGLVVREIEGHTNNVLGVAFGPDGNRIATASTDTTLAVWDVATGDELQRLNGHTGPVFSVAFSPDGERILSGCWDGTARLWDADTGVELFTLGELERPIAAAVFSPDGKRIAAGGGAPGRIANATVWDSSRGRVKL